MTKKHESPKSKMIKRGSYKQPTSEELGLEREFLSPETIQRRKTASKDLANLIKEGERKRKSQHVK